MITIIDYGIGNVASVKNMLHRNGEESQLSSDPEIILDSQKIILPGVGSFDTAMQKLHDLNLIETIREFSRSGKPLLGICLGAQLLMSSSEEGKLEGLNLIQGRCEKFQRIEPLTVPHMNWNDVNFVKDSSLTNTFRNRAARFYFVHSYHMIPAQAEDILGTAFYGYEFTCAVGRDNIAGVQFHPEKSHRFGAELLQNFSNL